MLAVSRRLAVCSPEHRTPQEERGEFGEGGVQEGTSVGGREEGWRRKNVTDEICRPGRQH